MTHQSPPRPRLSPTPRTTLRRNAARTREDRADLYDVLDAAYVCHLGVLLDGHPVVVPTAFAYDSEGPDAAGSLYLHGSVASRSLRETPEREVCVTVTVLDGLVLARAGFHHSMNYRSAVVVGRGRHVEDPAERARALDLVVDHVAPGRAETLRAPTRKELAATRVVAVPLAEASVKVRSGDPVDEPGDVAAGGWAGVVPVRRVLEAPRTASDARGEQVPDEVTALARVPAP